VEVTASAGEVTGDPDRLKQALVHLGGFLLRRPGNTRLSVRAEAGDDVARIVLAGNGEAVPAEESDRLFEPYVRVPRRGPLAQGLGLALARVVVELHGGAVRLDQPAEGGNAFVVTLKSAGPSPNHQREE
jgi:signal transduction histidine kinase